MILKVVILTKFEVEIVIVNYRKPYIIVMPLNYDTENTSMRIKKSSKGIFQLLLQLS